MNLYIVKRTHQHTVIGTTLIVLSILSFFLILFLENLEPLFEPVYRIFPHILGNVKFYFVTAVVVWYCWAQDLAFEAFERFSEAFRKAESKAKLDEVIEKRHYSY